MTTIKINENLKDFNHRTYNTYQELMEDLAEYHGYKILWQVNEKDLSSEVKEALEEYKNNPPEKLFDI